MKGIMKGLGITLRHLFKKPVTIQYPDEKRVMPPRFRGRHVHTVDPATGRSKCIGCGMCARICPTGTIHVETAMTEDKKRVVTGFTLDLGNCAYCGLCQDVCPVKAIVMGDEYENAVYDRKKLVLSLEQMLATAPRRWEGEPCLKDSCS